MPGDFDESPPTRGERSAKKRVRLPIGVDRVLDQWYLDTLGNTAPEPLRRLLAAEIALMKQSAVQTGRRRERALWSKDAWRGVESDPDDTNAENLP